MINIHHSPLIGKNNYVFIFLICIVVTWIQTRPFQDLRLYFIRSRSHVSWITNYNFLKFQTNCQRIFKDFTKDSIKHLYNQNLLNYTDFKKRHSRRFYTEKLRYLPHLKLKKVMGKFINISFDTCKYTSVIIQSLISKIMLFVPVRADLRTKTEVSRAFCWILFTKSTHKGRGSTCSSSSSFPQVYILERIPTPPGWFLIVRGKMKY